MTKTKLAKQLRMCQHRFGDVPRVLIDAVPDEKLIESYVTCSDCGKWLVSQDELEQAINDSEDADEFLAIVDELTCHPDSITNTNPYEETK